MFKQVPLYSGRGIIPNSFRAGFVRPKGEALWIHEWHTNKYIIFDK